MTVAVATLGLSVLSGLEFLTGPMFVASLVGVVAGILARRFLQRNKKPG